MRALNVHHVHEVVVPVQGAEDEGRPLGRQLLQDGGTAGPLRYVGGMLKNYKHDYYENIINVIKKLKH